MTLNSSYQQKKKKDGLHLLQHHTLSVSPSRTEIGFNSQTRLIDVWLYLDLTLSSWKQNLVRKCPFHARITDQVVLTFKL